MSSIDFPEWLNLSINGSLTGTPTEVRTFTFTVEVSDNEDENNKDFREFTLIIENSNKDTASPTWPKGYQLAKHEFIIEPETGVADQHAKIWVQIDNLNMINLATLGGRSDEGLGINNLVHMVGISDISGYIEVNRVVKEYTRHGFVYNPIKGMRDFNNLIAPELKWEIEKAYDINDIGLIVAIGIVNGERHASLLTPRHSVDIYNAKLKIVDIKSTDWFFESIIRLFPKGIISGYSDGTFKLNKDINFDEFIKMMVTAIGYTDIDLDENYWADSYIKKAEEIGIIKTGEYNSYNQVITREEMSRVVARAVKERSAIDLSKYEDKIKDFGSIAPDS